GNLKDFSGKAILFCFWKTNIQRCVMEMPKLDSLQKKFADRLQIVMVSREPAVVVSSYLKNYERQHHLRWMIPVVVGDTLLHKYFRHLSEPSYALLARENRLVAQVDPDILKMNVVETFLDYTPIEDYRYERSRGLGLYYNY